MPSAPQSRRRVGLTLAAALSFACAGGREASGPATVIQNKGSDTMVNVAQAWAEEYALVAPDVKVEVSGGGSGVGIAALIKGAVDIASASRNIKDEEIEQVRLNTGKDPRDFVVGYDALAVYVHEDNPLTHLDRETLAGIFGEHGTIERWSELGVRFPGVEDDRIVRVSRQSSSGTFEFFRSWVVGKKDFKLGSRDLNGSKEVVELVGHTLTAIGFSGMGYATPAVKMLGLADAPGAAPVPPSLDAVLDGSYPLARSLHLYTLGEPKGATQAYLDWILSEPGQQVVARSGYVPVPPSARAAAGAGAAAR